ncbi:peptidoglycan D,D-transpeptidase FtsI family protein [Cellulomonas hominis]
MTPPRGPGAPRTGSARPTPGRAPGAGPPAGARVTGARTAAPAPTRAPARPRQTEPAVRQQLPAGRPAVRRPGVGRSAGPGGPGGDGGSGPLGPRGPRPEPGPAPVTLRRRQTVLVVSVLVLLSLFAGRLLYLQGFRGEAIAAEALQSRLSSASLLAGRGEITDANGVALATSVERYTVFVNQKQLATWKRSSTADSAELNGPAGAASLLAPVLGLNAAELGAALTGDAGYKVIAKDVLPETWQVVRDLRIDGIGGTLVSDRVYPNGNLAGNLLGWVNSEGVGAAGLESKLDDELSGTAGTFVFERGAGGQEIPGGYQEEKPAVPGRSVRLTLDNDVQWKSQEAITNQVAATGADSGSIVVLNIKTGEILALADSATVDPNNPGATTDLWNGSPAVSNVFDPGSTAKVITMASAIETGLVNPLSQFEVPYQFTTPNNQTFKDSHEHEIQKLTTTGILANSSNTGTVMIGQNIPQQVRYDYLAKFGFGTRTGIELPNESPGLLRPADDWDGRTKYAVLFGQGLSVTALQAIEVFATIGNDGVRVQPHLIKGWTEADGTYVPGAAPATTQVVSPVTADTVLTMMESAVDEGTGGNAAILGYRVAGKTGTAQMFNPDGIAASFIGVAPADDPQIAVAVVLLNPTSSVYGGDVAAPVFSDVAGFTLGELGIAPSGTPATLFPTTW